MWEPEWIFCIWQALDYPYGHNTFLPFSFSFFWWGGSVSSMEDLGSVGLVESFVSEEEADARYRHRH